MINYVKFVYVFLLAVADNNYCESYWEATRKNNFFYAYYGIIVDLVKDL